MSGPKPGFLFLFLVLLILVLGGVAVAKGGFFIAKHEGDTLHLMQIVFRMADGELPHLDFMTPIGIFAFWPIVAFLNLGFGIGAAILWSQILVALALLLPAFWAAWSRFDTALAYLFGLAVMVLTLALVHGESDQLVSVSMHYNRWAWAVAYIVIVLAVLPAVKSQSEGLDGLVIGLGLSVLALSKVTYFIAFAPAVVLALLLRNAGATLALALLSGLVPAGVVTAAAGIDFWPAYLDDLRAVAGSEVRPQPGAPLATVIGAPQYLGGGIALILGIIFLRQAGVRRTGLALLLLVPGFFYVTFQNFGNDPQWLMLLAILLLAPWVAPEATNRFGWRLDQALAMTAVAALAFAAPSFLNLAYSPFRHFRVTPAEYTPLLASSARHGDLFGRLVRSNRVDGAVALDGTGSGLEDRQQAARRAETAVTFQGEEFEQCELQLGIIAWFETIVADLEAAGLAGGKRIFAADIFASHWLFGDFARLKGGAPWYYGGLPGIETADYLLVPLCPASLAIRKQILEEVAARGITVSELRRTPLYVLYGLGEG